MITQTIDLNLIPESSPVIVHCDQYDEGTGRIIAHLYKGDVSYSATGTAMIQGTKPDGKGFQYDATLSGNTVTANLTKQMTACAGRVRTQIVVTESSGRTGTFVFVLDVQKSALPADTDMSASEYQLISQVLDNVEAVGQEAISDINDAIDGAEANLNSKVSAAATSATNAAASAAAAAQSASEAEQYAEGGLIYKRSILFANIPTTDLKVGNMYNIENDFTTDSRFQEGAGISVKAGTNIAWNGSKWDLLAVGAAGHKIVNSSGTVMTARSKLKFVNSTVTDDSANDTTVVTPQGSQISLPLSIANGGTGNTSGYIRTGQKANTTISTTATAEGVNNTASGTSSHAEGENTTASSYQAHAEGKGTTASGYQSHAEGCNTTASKNYGHAEGYQTTAGYCAHAEGYYTSASGNYAHAEGDYTQATQQSAHAEGSYAIASGQYAHAEGRTTSATNNGAHAEGGATSATGFYAHAEGYSTTAADYAHAEGYHTVAGYECNHAQGHYNKDMASGSSSGTSGNAMAIGNGISPSNSSNAFRVTFAGQVYGLSAFNSSGADYAEFFEWKDGNSNDEDRVGYFVTLDGEKIKIADKDDYILGVISGQPSVIGNGDEDWLGRWQRDDFGRFIWGDIETENSEGEKETIHTILPNPDYDSTQKYIERKDRKEWDYVGMLGNIAVRDDGTCEVNGFCTVADGGVATKAETGYRVIKRVSDNVVKIILK